MRDVFISYARSTAAQAASVADALRAAGYAVWRDDELPAHRAYGDVIEERLAAAKAVVVLRSADAARSEWVRSEANAAREQRKLVQLALDGTRLPMPFDQIQCAQLQGWDGDVSAPGWQKVLASVAELLGTATAMAPGQSPTSTSTSTARAAVATGGASAALRQKPSIAVLPFANLSGDPEQTYFADGVALEIVDALSRSRAIIVIASSSSMPLKGQGLGAQDAARQLGVRFVLEGSVRKAGGRVRIGVQLVDASDGSTIWTERFEDTLDDIFDLQDRVALAVAGKIEPTIEQVEIRRASTRASGDAHDLYLRALPAFRAHTREGMDAAMALLQQCLTLDAGHAPALALNVSCHRTIVAFGWSADAASHRAAGIELARRAISCGANDATVLASVANDLTILEQRLDVALPLAARAIAINPGSANVWFNCGCVRLMAGEQDVAQEHFETAMRLDPIGSNRPVYLLWLAGAHFFAQRFEVAAALLTERNQHVESPSSMIHLAACLGHLGQVDATRAALARYRELTSMPVEAFAQIWLRQADRDLLLRGISLATGDPS